MSNNVLNVLGNYISFLDKVFNLLEKDNIDVSGYQLDHICYRVETVQRYGELKTIFLKSAELLSETIIGGRMISSFKLEQPLMYKEREIFIIEIPAPKEKNKYSEGLEHVEFVIDKSFEEFKNQYKNLNFDTRAEGKEINPDIQLRYEDCSVKFHQNSLEYVIKYLE